MTVKIISISRNKRCYIKLQKKKCLLLANSGDKKVINQHKHIFVWKWRYYGQLRNDGKMDK
jgi:hypothetical protein